MQNFTFRGKSQDTGEWLIGNNIVADPKRTTINGVTVDPATIGQYIRRTADNNAPIFTGDIISLFPDEDIIIDTVMPEPESLMAGCIIKGNIYDNPKLIKE